MSTFPKTWQRNWDNSGRSLATATVNDIITYFGKQKIAADSDYSTAHGRNKRKGFGRGRGRGRNQYWMNNNNNNNEGKRLKTGQKYLSNDSPCPIHLHGTHKWGECRDNKKSANFVPLNYNYNRNIPQPQQGGYMGRG